MANTYTYTEYKLPKKMYIFQNAIPVFYSKVKDDILKEIKDVSFYSATTDMWSGSTMTAYMSLIMHDITAGWRPVTYLYVSVDLLALLCHYISSGIK